MVSGDDGLKAISRKESTCHSLDAVKRNPGLRRGIPVPVRKAEWYILFRNSPKQSASIHRRLYCI
jgi:hypothetical protein